MFKQTKYILMRNKEETKRKLIEALGAIVRSKGFNNLAVDKMAKDAGVPKIMIYRYFGGLDQLRQAYIIENDFLRKYLSTYPAAHDSSYSMHAQVSKILYDHSEEFYSHCEIEALLMNEICNTRIISNKIKWDLPKDLNIHFEVMSTLLSAGTEQLILNGIIDKKGQKKERSLNQQQDLIQFIQQIVDWTLG